MSNASPTNTQAERAKDNKDDLSKASATNIAENDIQIKTINTTHQCEICIPGSVHDLVSYVLIEQETWFEPELEFLVATSSYFKRAIDISALYGIYSLPLSSQLDKIFVFESSPVTTWYLKHSIENNKIKNISIISRNSTDAAHEGSNDSPSKDPITSRFNLDESSKLFSLDNIDLVIINLGGDEQNVLINAKNFLESNQPLIMHRRNNEERVNKKIVNTLKQSHYDCYYLVPGVNILAPLEDISILESSTTNFFFCKSITAEKLKLLGFLATSLTEVTNDNSYEKDLKENMAELLSKSFEKYAYGRLLSNNWSYEYITEDTASSHYQKSLYYYFQAHNKELDANQRLLYLMESFNSLSASLQTQAGLSQLLSLTRISSELGLSSTALQALSVILETFCSDQTMTADVPFLSPHKIFDQVDPAEQFGEWVFSSVLQTYLWTKSFSSYFMDTNELQTLQGLSADPFVQARTERAKQLLSIKLGKTQVTENHKVLEQETKNNLNVRFWNKQ